MKIVRKLALLALLLSVVVVGQQVNIALAAMTPAPGYAVSDFATGFANCGGIGPIGVTFDSSNNLLVTNRCDNNYFKFDPSGGAASSHIVTNLGSGAGPHGLAFGKDGELYVADRDANKVEQIDPSTGAVVRTLLSLTCASGLATDPLSGDLFVSFPSCNNNIDRIANPATCGTTCTASVYIAPGGTDGLTFAPDGTLYTETNGCAYQIAPTSVSPTTATQIACPGNSMDGIALSPTSGAPLIFANGNNGTIVKIDQSTSPATMTTIASGGSRGDFVTVGPDGCLYATQSDRIEKVTNANGTCSWTPASVIPQLRLAPDQVAPTLIGTSAQFKATVTNASPVSGIAVTFTIPASNPDGTSNANPQTKVVNTNSSGVATFTYSGTNTGTDRVTATATAGSVTMVSNTGSVLWENATLTLSPTSGSYGTSVKVSGGHYQAGEQVNVYLNNASTTPVLMTTASSTGTISGSFKVGAMPNGFYPVLAVGQTGGNQGNATFQMGAMSVFSATSGGQGTALTYIVRGFLPNENVNLYFGTTGCPTCNQLPSFKTNGVGSGAQIFHVPELGGGSYQIRVVGQTSGIVISKPYKIVNSITLLPTSGLPGATTTIFGAGFGPNESVTVTFNCGSASCTGGTAMGTVQTDNRGDFTLVDTATPTGAAAGSYPIGALGQSSKLFAKATFTVS